MALLPQSNRAGARKGRPAALLEAGRAAFKSEDYAASERNFVEALAAGAPPAECRLYLARVYNRNKDWSRALEQWAWLVAEDPAQAEPQLQVARAQLRLGRYGEAAAGFRAVLDLDSDHAEARKSLPATLLEAGRVAFKSEDYAASEHSFLAAMDAGGPPAECRRALARIYNLKQDWARALEQWAWLRAEDRAQLEPRLQVARAQFRLGRYGDAAAAFRSVLDLEPDHAEARQAVLEIERLDRGEMPAPSESRAAPAPAAPPAEWMPLSESDDYARNEAGVVAAVRAGADEGVCRLLLARIYNLKQDWPNALEQWAWLRERYPGQREPQLQLARGQFKLGLYAEAKAAFEAFLSLVPDHQEAQATLHQIEETLAQEGPDAETGEAGDWLSRLSGNMRWPLAAELLGVEMDALEATIDLATRQATALSALVDAYGQATGEIGNHRQLYGVQAAAGIDELKSQLKRAGSIVRNLTQRTERILTIFGKTSGRSMPSAAAVTPQVPRVSWRNGVVRIALETYREHGFGAALRWLFRTGRVDERPKMLSDFGTGMQKIDRDAAVRAYWLAYGTSPSADLAKQMAQLMLQTGDLSNSEALLEAAPTGSAATPDRARQPRSVADRLGDIKGGVDGAAETD